MFWPKLKFILTNMFNKSVKLKK